MTPDEEAEEHYNPIGLYHVMSRMGLLVIVAVIAVSIIIKLLGIV